MKNLFVLSAGLLAMLVVVANGKPTKSITGGPDDCPKNDRIGHIDNVADPENCSRYYSCIDGTSFLTSCAEIDHKGNRYYFNPHLKRCDLPKNVKCAHKPSPNDPEVGIIHLDDPYLQHGERRRSNIHMYE